VSAATIPVAGILSKLQSFFMKFVRMVVAVPILALCAFPQQPPKSVTVPVTLDHNRMVIDVYLPLPDGTSKRVRARVDSGNSEMTMSPRIAALLGFVSCDGQVSNATPPRELVIGGIISLPGVRTAGLAKSLPPHLLQVTDNFMTEGMTLPPDRSAPCRAMSRRSLGRQFGAFLLFLRWTIGERFELPVTSTAPSSSWMKFLRG